MASSPKRLKLSEVGKHDDDSTQESEDQKLFQFLDWCKGEGFTLNEKVTVSREGSCAQYGMIAVDDIEKGEVLFHVPRSSLLHPQTSSIKDFLKKNEDKLESVSGWVPLLLCLMYEYTNPASQWRPYLDLFPCFEELDLPMFWGKQEVLDELKGTGIPEAVGRDQKNIEEEYTKIVVPCIKLDPILFNPTVHSLELYKKMVAFVMSYSFTEPSNQSKDDDEEEDPDDNNTHHPPPIMVPLADALNHVAKNNAHLRFCKESLKMGDEVFNTFGELANWQLLHMYGFAEAYPHNTYDTVDIPMRFILEQAKLKASDNNSLDERWQYLEQLDIVAEEGSFVIGREGILTIEELYTTLKVLSMKPDAFKEFKEKDGWDSDEDDEDSDILMNENLHKLPSHWKELLQRVLKCCLKQYHNTFEEDKALLQKEKFNKLSRRQQFSLHVRIGQKQLLTRTLNLLLGPEKVTNQPHPGQGDHCVIC